MTRHLVKDTYFKRCYENYKLFRDFWEKVVKEIIKRSFLNVRYKKKGTKKTKKLYLILINKKFKKLMNFQKSEKNSYYYILFELKLRELCRVNFNHCQQ